MTKKLVLLVLLVGGFQIQAKNINVREVVVRTGPSLYLNAEYGFFYANTGRVPAKLEFLCSQEDQKQLSLCGTLDVHMQIKSYGLSVYWLNYTRKNSLRVRLHVNPLEATLTDILGSYVGGRAGGGLGVGLRGMVLVNAFSGVFATTKQNLMPIGNMDRTDAGFDVGLDLSVPQLELQYDGKADLNQPLVDFAT